MTSCMDTDHYGPTDKGSHFGCRFYGAEREGKRRGGGPVTERLSGWALDRIEKVAQDEGDVDTSALIAEVRERRAAEERVREAIGPWLAPDGDPYADARLCAEVVQDALTSDEGVAR